MINCRIRNFEDPMNRSTKFFPICQRIKSLNPIARFGELLFENKFRFPGKNLCFVRPHSTLVKERLTGVKGEAPDISSRPNQHLALKPQDKEASPLNREASNAHNCSMDSRHQRLAVYAYLWAQHRSIQLKHIFFIRTREQGIAGDTLRLLQNPAQNSETWLLSKKYAVRVVSEKGEQNPHDIILPISPDPFVKLTRVISYRD